MKKLFWLIAFSLATFTVLGQDLNLKRKTYWENEKTKFNFEKPIIIDLMNNQELSYPKLRPLYYHSEKDLNFH